MSALAARQELDALVGGDPAIAIAGLPGPQWMKQMRKTAFDNLIHMGLPAAGNEAWKYTRLPSLAALGLRVAGQPASSQERPAPLLAGSLRLLLVNGFIDHLPTDLPNGVHIGRLSDAADSPVVQRWLAKMLRHDDKPMAALNSSLFTDGLFLHIEKGLHLEQPIEITSLGAAGATALEFNPRCLVVVEDGAAATIVEHHAGTGNYLSNGVVEFALGESARLWHGKLQEEGPEAIHLATTGISLAAGATFHGVLLQLGGKLARHEVHAALHGDGASFQMDSAFVAAGKQHLDQATTVLHQAVAGRSRQSVKGVLKDEARGSFLGKVLVERGAQKTDAHQRCQALLLSDRAEMDSRPELEIYADDVKCGHGASVGDLDEAALFYLRSRGLDGETARRLLIEGFLAEIMDQIPSDPLRREFAARLNDRLGLGEKEAA